jgi:hypothetical protein
MHERRQEGHAGDRLAGHPNARAPRDQPGLHVFVERFSAQFVADLHDAPPGKEGSNLAERVVDGLVGRGDDKHTVAESGQRLSDEREKPSLSGPRRPLNSSKLGTDDAPAECRLLGSVESATTEDGQCRA